jgi:hypothetical protein
VIHHDLADIHVKVGDIVEPRQVLATYTHSRLMNADIVNKLTILEGYFELLPSLFPAAAVLAPCNGTVMLTPTKEGIQIHIAGEEDPVCVVRDVPVIVCNGQYVETGDPLTYGDIDIDALYAMTNDLPLTASVFVSRVHALYAEEGIEVDPVHIELVFRGMPEIVTRHGPQKLGLRRCEHKGDYQVNSGRLSNRASTAFFLPWRARRSKEAACTVRAVGLRIRRGPNSARNAEPNSCELVRAVGARYGRWRSSALPVALRSPPSLQPFSLRLSYPVLRSW